MDVHRKRTQVAVLDEDGTELVNSNVDNGSVAMRELLEDLPRGTEVAFEAGYGWSWVLDLLQDLGHEPHLAHPGGCRAIASARLKNDRVDARTLAHLLRTDLLAESWIAPAEVRGMRSLLRHRTQLVRTGTALKCRIHALLADAGLTLPSSLWTGLGRTWLAAQTLPEASQRVVKDCLGVIDLLAELRKTLEREIRSSYRPDPRVEALQRLPGVGPIIAMILVAEIGDISRFPTARKLCSWAGLTPVERSSDKTVRRGHISKQGPTLVRWALGEAAHLAKKQPPFAPFYHRVAKRRGAKIATVAVARKLLARSFHLLHEVEVSAPGELAV
jgi:transposase